LFTLNAGAAEDELTTCAISIVEHAVTENKKPCDITVGCARLFKELESSKINFHPLKNLFVFASSPCKLNKSTKLILIVFSFI